MGAIIISFKNNGVMSDLIFSQLKWFVLSPMKGYVGECSRIARRLHAGSLVAPRCMSRCVMQCVCPLSGTGKRNTFFKRASHCVIASSYMDHFKNKSSTTKNVSLEGRNRSKTERAADFTSPCCQDACPGATSKLPGQNWSTLSTDDVHRSYGCKCANAHTLPNPKQIKSSFLL